MNFNESAFIDRIYNMSRQFVHREDISSPTSLVRLSMSLTRYVVTGAVLPARKTGSTSQVNILASFAHPSFVLI